MEVVVVVVVVMQVIAAVVVVQVIAAAKVVMEIASVVGVLVIGVHLVEKKLLVALLIRWWSWRMTMVYAAKI